MDCIFCKIINGEIPSYCVYENDYVKAFLDVNPSSDGHTLIIPKKHYENLFDIDTDVLKEIENASKIVSKKLMDNLLCDGVTRLQNNGYGQEVKHYHMHLIPRYKNNDINIELKSTEKKDINSIFDQINK